MRKVESRIVILRNMVSPKEVDSSLQDEIQEECSKYGVVQRLIIYKEKQSEDDEDDNNVIVKIFVAFSQMSGETHFTYVVKFIFDSKSSLKCVYCRSGTSSRFTKRTVLWRQNSQRRTI